MIESKAAIKTAASKKPISSKATQSDTLTDASLSNIKSILDEMKNDRESRDRQLAALAEGVREGLSVITEQVEDRDSRRDKEMLHLFEGLNAAFTRANTVSNERDDRSVQIINKLTESVMHDHEATLKEVHEQEVLADKKLGYLSEVQAQRSKLTRWIAVPGVGLAVIAVIYMFFVVTVMEKAMTSMSKDMQYMTISVNSMNSNMTQMTRDMNVMTRTTAPVMQGMRNAMPWAP
ncbi:MAG: hypothetical protein ABUK13_01930 [Gammaproteobacteria bacterium]